MPSVPEQISSFLLLMGLGITAGWLFDCYRTIRLYSRPRPWGTALGDALFWLVLTALTYGVLTIRTWGEVRLYVFLSMALGVLIYLRFFSRRTSAVLRKLCRILAQAARRVISPVRRLKRVLTRQRPPHDKNIL